MILHIKVKQRSIFQRKAGGLAASGSKFYLVGIISGLACQWITGRICGYFNKCWFFECITTKISLRGRHSADCAPTIAPFKAGLIVAGVALILNAASDTFMLSLLKPLLDDGFGKTDRSVLVWMPLVVIGLMILRGITSYVSSYCISRVSGKVVMTMRRRLFGHMMGMPVSFFDKQSTGTLLSRITYDSEQVASSSSGALITVVREGASIIGLFIMMFYYSWQLSIILIVLAPIVSIAIRVVSKRFRNISKNMQNTMGQVTTSAEQMLKGHKEVLIFGGQEVETKRFDKVSNRMRLQGDENGFSLFHL